MQPAGSIAMQQVAETEMCFRKDHAEEEEGETQQTFGVNIRSHPLLACGRGLYVQAAARRHQRLVLHFSGAIGYEITPKW